MNQKMRNILGWALTLLVTLIFIGSAAGKFFNPASLPENLRSIGRQNIVLLAGIELVSVTLFIVPRTAIVGALFLIAYMGGAIVEHLIAHNSLLAPISVQILIWITAFIRFEELSSRLMKKQLLY